MMSVGDLVRKADRWLRLFLWMMTFSVFSFIVATVSLAAVVYASVLSFDDMLASAIAIGMVSLACGFLLKLVAEMAVSRAAEWTLRAAEGQSRQRMRLMIPATYGECVEVLSDLNRILAEEKAR